MHTSESVSDLWPALLEARKKFKPVVKDSQAQIGAGRLYTYADLSTLLEAVQPALLEHHLLVLQGVDAESSTLVSRIIHAPSSQYLEVRYPLNLEQAPQQLGSAITYSRRYQLLCLLSVAAEDDDGAAAQGASASSSAAPSPRSGGNRAITPGQVKLFWAKAGEHQWSRDQATKLLLFRFKVDRVEAIRMDSFDSILQQLEQGPPTSAADGDERAF